MEWIKQSRIYDVDCQILSLYDPASVTKWDFVKKTPSPNFNEVMEDSWWIYGLIERNYFK